LGYLNPDNVGFLMTTFNEQISTALDIFYSDEYAVDATYNGEAVKVLDGTHSDHTEQSFFNTYQTTITIRQSEVTQPLVGDMVDYQGFLWRVIPGANLSNGEWSITLVRDDVSVVV
jgi:hypothetical protein